MNLLLDTHAVLWWLAGEGLAPAAEQAVADVGNVAYVSAASLWEISIKASLGKLDLMVPLAALQEAIEADFEPLPITWQHGLVAGALPLHHRDPFDRMLIAQAAAEALHLVTRDQIFERYDVPVIRA